MVLKRLKSSEFIDAYEPCKLYLIEWRRMKKSFIILKGKYQLVAKVIYYILVSAAVADFGHFIPLCIGSISTPPIY